MKARWRFLQEHSLRSALSAIEIYNKPEFREREQVFAILMVTAWESLLKAKIVRDSKNKLTSIYVRQGHRFKTKAGKPKAYVTIGIDAAITKCALPPVVAENISHLIDVRDAAIHLTAESKQLPMLMFTLGAATLKNYARLSREWFDESLSDVNFHILPLGFEYPFRSIEILDLQKEPEEIAEIVRAVGQAQESGTSEGDGYFLVCELRTELVAASKLLGAADIVAAVDPANANAVVVTRPVKPTDKYPYTYHEMFARVRQALPGLKQQQFTEFIARNKIKGDTRYSTYNFTSKKAEKRGVSKSTPVIYNEDCVRFIVEGLRPQLGVVANLARTGAAVSGPAAR
jgi:hypothetical protein